MNYKTHPGVVMTTICDTAVLIPLRLSYPNLQKTIPLPPLMAPLWDLLSSGKSLDAYISFLSALTRKDKQTVSRRVERTCEELCKLGYLIAVPDGEPVEDLQSQEESGTISQNHLPQDE